MPGLEIGDETVCLGYAGSLEGIINEQYYTNDNPLPTRNTNYRNQNPKL